MEDPMYRGEANVTTRINHPANAGAAARLCATLAAAGQPCQPTVFDGQRLALR